MSVQFQLIAPGNPHIDIGESKRKFVNNGIKVHLPQDLEIHRLSIANDLNDLLVEKGRQYHIFRIFTFLVGILMTIGFFAGRFIIGLNSTLQYVFLSFACIGFLIMLASFGAVFRERLLLKSVQKFIDNLNSNDNLTYRYEIRQVDRDDKDFEGSKTTVQDWLVTVTIPV